MKRRAILIAASAALTACGGSQEATAPACERTDEAPRYDIQEIEVEQACGMSPGEGLTVRFVPTVDDDGSRCMPAIVAVAPQDYATPRISLNFITNGSRLSGQSLTVRDFLFSDRLTNSSQLRLSPDTACGELDIRAQDIRCRASAEDGEDGEDGEDYTDCGPVTFEGTEMFSSFEAPQGE